MDFLTFWCRQTFWQPSGQCCKSLGGCLCSCSGWSVHVFTSGCRWRLEALVISLLLWYATTFPYQKIFTYLNYSKSIRHERQHCVKHVYEDNYWTNEVEASSLVVFGWFPAILCSSQLHSNVVRFGLDLPSELKVELLHSWCRNHG